MSGGYKMENNIKEMQDKVLKKLKEKDKEIERLNNIMNKAIEYIGEPNDNYWCEEARDLLEILEGGKDT